MTSIPATALPSLIDWPRDEAAHDGFPWEIWWITADLDVGGRRLVAHALFNHQAGGGLALTTTISDVAGGVERTRRDYFAPGETSLSRDALDIETPLCSLRGSYAEGYRLKARMDEEAGFDLVLKPGRPVLHNGGSGQFDFQGVTTTQYSVGFLETTGTVRLNGQDLAASGRAWHDRQWDHAPRATMPVFTWFGLCLDDGDTLSVFDTRGGPGEGHSWVTIARPDGTHIVAAAAIAAEGNVTTALGRAVPQRWTLTIPAVAARLQLAQRLVADGSAIYTGVIDIDGSCDGGTASGYGFCDIVGPIGDGGGSAA